MKFLMEESEDMKIGIEQLEEMTETIQQNVKLLVEISNSHSKYTKELNDRIVDITSQFESLDTKQEMPIDTISKIQTGTQPGNSSGPSNIKRDIASPRKVTIKNGDKHTRVIRIKTDEDDDTPLSSK